MNLIVRISNSLEDAYERSLDMPLLVGAPVAMFVSLVVGLAVLSPVIVGMIVLWWWFG